MWERTQKNLPFMPGSLSYARDSLSFIRRLDIHTGNLSKKTSSQATLKKVRERVPAPLHPFLCKRIHPHPSAFYVYLCDTAIYSSKSLPPLVIRVLLRAISERGFTVLSLILELSFNRKRVCVCASIRVVGRHRVVTYCVPVRLSCCETGAIKKQVFCSVADAATLTQQF